MNKELSAAVNSIPLVILSQSMEGEGGMAGFLFQLVIVA